jgi:anti-sigma regulatory factor (Ser/Thr protein kinase)
VVDGESSREQQADRSFHHELLLCAGEDGFRDGTLPFIHHALATGQPLLVAVSDQRIKLLEETLGPDAGRVDFTDMHTLGHNPARIIPAWREFLERNARGGRPVSVIGEPVWPGRSQPEVAECERHESLLNLAFAGQQATRLLCSYDIANLDEPTIQAARQSHPFIIADGVSARSDAYLDAREAPGPFDGALPQPRGRPAELTFTREELVELRGSVAAWASDAGLGAEGAERLVLALNELATNSVRYGGGRGILRMWREGDTLIFEIHDHGRIEDPLVGRIAPAADQLTGRGLWFVNQICDLVQIRSTARGNVVRVHLHMP